MGDITRLSEVRGMMLISRQEGAHLGYVERIFIDPASGSLSAVTFRHSRLTPEQAVTARNLTAFGRDVAFIENESSVMTVEDALKEGDRPMHDIQGLRVTTRNGTRVGALMDVGVSAGSWRIAEIYLPGGRILKINPDDLTIGRDEVLVPTDGAERLEKRNEDLGRELIGRLFGVDGLSEAFHTLTRRPTARAVILATKGVTVPEATATKATSGRPRKTADKTAAPHPNP